MDERPWIGIEADVDSGPKGEFAKLYPRYWQAVLVAGGLPLIIPPVADPDYLQALLPRLDGLVLPGGDDLCPPVDQPAPGIVPALATRHDFARLLLQEGLRRDLPILAVCFGMQILAEIHGADFIYDLPSQHPTSIEHRRSGIGHALEVVAGSQLATALGNCDSLHSNSMHHQAVRSVHAPLVVSARAPDGVIEAIEHPGKSWCIGVQWHPEAMPEDPAMQSLFASLVGAARQQARSLL